MTLKTRSALLLALPLAVACGGADPAPAIPAPADARPSTTAAASPGPAASGALYSEDQAGRGRQVFRARCSECHYSSEMRDDQFQFEWERRTVGDLLEHVAESMPEDAPGSLSMTEYVDVIAYILSLNGFPAGPSELTAGSPAMEASMKAPGATP